MRRRDSMGGVVHAQRRTVGIPEVELSQIAVQMLLAAVQIDALHAALEDAERAFDGVGVDDGGGVPDVLALAVVGGLVSGEGLADADVVALAPN